MIVQKGIFRKKYYSLLTLINKGAFIQIDPEGRFRVIAPDKSFIHTNSQHISNLQGLILTEEQIHYVFTRVNKYIKKKQYLLFQQKQDEYKLAQEKAKLVTKALHKLESTKKKKLDSIRKKKIEEFAEGYIAKQKYVAILSRLLDV